MKKHSENSVSGVSSHWGTDSISRILFVKRIWSRQGIELERAIAVFSVCSGRLRVATRNCAVAMGVASEKVEATAQRTSWRGARLEADVWANGTGDVCLGGFADQETLTEDELAEVTNMSRTQIRGTVKHLVSIGVLKRTPMGL